MSTNGVTSCEVHYLLNTLLFIYKSYLFGSLWVPLFQTTNCEYFVTEAFHADQAFSFFYFKEVQTIFMCAQGLAVVYTLLTSLQTVGACNTELVLQSTKVLELLYQIL